MRKRSFLGLLAEDRRNTLTALRRLGLDGRRRFRASIKRVLSESAYAQRPLLDALRTRSPRVDGGTYYQVPVSLKP